ncbi:MAG: peptidase MA family metallohydrolase [bacterium]
MRDAARGAFAAAAFLAATALFATPQASRAVPVLFVEGAPLQSGLRSLLLQEATSAHEEGARWFGVEVQTPITIRWVTDGQELRRRTGREPGTIAGAAVPAKGEIVLFAPALMSSPNRIGSVMRHEMCHLLLAQATSHATVEAPRWLDEGIATWRSEEWDLTLAPRRDQAGWIRDAAAAGHLFSFEALDARFPDGALQSLAYAESASFVEWLARRDGERRLKLFLRALDRDEDPEVAIRSTWGADLPTLEREWRKEVAGGPLSRVPTLATLTQAAGFLLGILVVVAWVRRRRRMSLLPDEPEAPPLG